MRRTTFEMAHRNFDCAPSAHNPQIVVLSLGSRKSVSYADVPLDNEKNKVKKK